MAIDKGILGHPSLKAYWDTHLFGAYWDTCILGHPSFTHHQLGQLGYGLLRKMGVPDLFLVNGKPLAITGGAVDCGGVIIGAGTVIVGDITPPVVSSLLQNLFFDRKITFSSDVGFLLEDSAGKILSSGRSGSAYTGLIKNSGTITAFIGGENE
jgi:hypothetical protein